MPGQRPSLDDVADRLAIDDLMDAYAVALDTKDWDALRTLFVPGAVVDYTEEGGVRGSIDDAIGWFQMAMGAFTASQHFVTNRRVRVSGDDATASAYIFSPLGAPNGNGGLTLVFAGGSYEDELRRTPDGWRFSSRTIHASWFHAGLQGGAAPPKTAP
ncbi:MAG: nuclear transport factor 2 family protein [Actinobacteria bacterium]|nr:MAG: nuclear transport factor 2 family protein [Actinomycetota bacterium]